LTLAPCGGCAPVPKPEGCALWPEEVAVPPEDELVAPAEPPEFPELPPEEVWLCANAALRMNAAIKINGFFITLLFQVVENRSPKFNGRQKVLNGADCLKMNQAKWQLAESSEESPIIFFVQIPDPL
jgi:hypothetical protein